MNHSPIEEARPNRYRHPAKPVRLLLAVFCVLLPLSAGVAAPSGKIAARPPRLGILHPYPRLCAQQEREQRDLRVLRLAYGIAYGGERWRRPPWFYVTEPGYEHPAGARSIRLDTTALWQWPRQEQPVDDAKSAGPEVPDPLEDWREKLLAQVPGLALVSGGGRAEFTLGPPGGHPFLLVRLRGSGLLPHYAFTRMGESRCQSWPTGTVFELQSGAMRYRLRRETGVAPHFNLTAFRHMAALRSAFARGKLDAILLEGEDLRGMLPPKNSARRLLLARMDGTQQLVLRIAKSFRDSLGGEGIAILSRAIARRKLAAQAGPGFAPSVVYLQPLLGAPLQDRRGPLLWDARLARRAWLKRRRGTGVLRLAVLDHPLLASLAHAVANQWKKTLGLSVVVRPFPAERFLVAENGPAWDLLLTAVDLDDGSLQDLWRPTLAVPAATETASAAENAPPASTQLTAWETRLQRELPYLPLVRNTHFLLARSQLVLRRAKAICPACTLVDWKVHARRRR